MYCDNEKIRHKIKFTETVFFFSNQVIGTCIGIEDFLKIFTRKITSMYHKMGGFRFKNTNSSKFIDTLYFVIFMV